MSGKVPGGNARSVKARGGKDRSGKARSAHRWVGTAHPQYLRHALAELRQLLGSGKVQHLAEGVFLFAADSPGPAAAHHRVDPEAGGRLPTFLRHLHPVQAEVQLFEGPAAAQENLHRLQSTLRQLLAAWSGQRPNWQEHGTTVQVQARLLRSETGWSRFALKEALDPVLAEFGFTPVTRGPQWVLSLTVAGPEEPSAGGLEEPLALIGLSTPAENLSPWMGGAIHYPREAVISRAGFKLLEALELFAPLGFEPQPGQRALDLGAAPGGWTQVLLEHGLAVTAVDPAPLDPRLLGRPGLTVLQQNAAEVRLPQGHFHLLTCDINWHPIRTAQMVAAAAPALAPGGWSLLTVKLLGRESPTRTHRQVARLLEDAAGLRVVTARQLFHNRDEVTLLLRRED